VVEISGGEVEISGGEVEISGGEVEISGGEAEISGGQISGGEISDRGVVEATSEVGVSVGTDASNCIIAA
jgi:hypothetical protein